MVEGMGERLLTVLKVIHLWADSEIITDRLSGDDDRPILSDGDLEVMYQRLPEYAMIAACGVDTADDLDSTKATLFQAATSSPDS